MTIPRFLVVLWDSNPKGEFHNHRKSKKLQQRPLVNSVNTQHLYGSGCHGLTSNDTQLERLISLWPGLQEHQKLAILAIASIDQMSWYP